MRYKLIKLARRILILLGGYKEMEDKHKLFRFFDPTTTTVQPQLLGEVLREHRFYYNTLSTTYRKQLYTVRRLIDYDHQIHLRFYEDGWVSGHYELRPDAHPLEHLDGVELRALRSGEQDELKTILGVVNE